MAYMNQESKAVVNAALKPILKRYGVKGTLSVRNHSTLVLTIKSGRIDFIGNMNRVCGGDHYQVSRGFTPAKDYVDVNPYWYHQHFDGDAKAFLAEALKAMKSAGWYDESDAMTDHFDIAYYVDINVGRWNKPYTVEA